MAKSIHSRKLYLINYAALLVLLGLTIGASYIDFGRRWNDLIAMGIAVIKGALIVLIFMHIRFEPRVTWAFAVAGFFWLGIMFTLTGAEYLTRNHPPHMDPKGEPVFLQHPGDRSEIPYQQFER